MIRKIKNESGFTLLELVIAVTILVGIMGGIFSFMQSTYKMANSITKLSDQHNVILNTNQFIRANLANATFVSLVDTDEPELYPESGYSYLYCGKKGGLTLLDGSTGNKTELYTTDALNCQKVFVLFRPDKLKELDVSGDYISTNPTELYDAGGNRVNTSTYANAYNNNSFGAFNGTYDAYTSPQAYGALTATIKVVAWSRDDDIKYNRFKYSSAEDPGPGTASACAKYFRFINEWDTGYYNMYLDEALNGYRPKGNTTKEPFTDGECFWSTAQEFSNEITFHNTNYVIVQHTYLDKTVTPNEFHRQGCDTISTRNDEPGTVLQPYLEAVPWNGLPLANGSTVPSPNVGKSNSKARLTNNVMNYVRCIKFQKPEVGGGVVSAGANIDIQNLTYSEEMRDSTKIVYKLVFDAVNTGSAGSKSWSFNYPVSIPAGKTITIESSSYCTATASGKTLTFNSVSSGTESSEMFSESGTSGAVKHCQVLFSIERDPDPTISGSVITTPHSPTDLNQGAEFKFTVNNPSSKWLGFKATLTWSDGTTIDVDNTAGWQKINPNGSKELKTDIWGMDVSMIMAEEPTVTFSDITYTDSQY